MTVVTNSIPTEPNIHDLTDVARRLQLIACGVDGFFAGQLQKLSDALQVYARIKAEADTVHRLLAQFESDRQQWQTQREAEINRLQRASENLVRAWEEIDVQQRALLLEQRRCDSAKNSAGSGHANRKPNDFPAIVKKPEKLESTLLEIQMLKRDMLDHAHRRR